MKEHCSIGYQLLVLVLIASVQVQANSMLDWFWSKSEDASKTTYVGDVPLVSIPYETLTEDEKFLKEAAKLVTDIQISSPLEICQHKVVMKIKTSCSSMSEEQLAKLSVNLLNCQSATEGRKTFPCSDSMSIKDCTSNMDPDTWNAYHLMSNRARAVCYASRSHQFRALTELTVNKLMESAQTQIHKLESLKESQNRLEEQTYAANTLIESNIQELTNEKALIRAGHAQLAEMTEDLKTKLERASQDMLDQAAERGENHLELLTDLENIKVQAQLLWEKIESSTNRIIEQNHDAAVQYQETLKKLEKINETIVYVHNLTDTMRVEIDKKLGWITEYIGSTGENLEKINRIVLHIMYLFGAMVVAAFLQAPFLTRSAILGIVPLNLASYLKHGFSASLDFLSITMLILLITAMHFVMNGIQYLLKPKRENNNEDVQKRSYSNGTNITTNTNGTTVINGHGDTRNEGFVNQNRSPSLFMSILYGLSNIWSEIKEQVFQSKENLKSVYLSIKSWIQQKFISTEELTCSYVPKRYHERILTGRGYPSISDDSSDYSNSRDSGKFVISDDNSITGAVLRRKPFERNISPLTAYFKGNRESDIRETMFVAKKTNPPSRSVTPVNRILCGARTRSGNPCRLLASKDQNFCHRHSSGSSTMGD